MRSLCVRAYLRTPVICDGALPLDGILLYQAARRRLGPRDATLPGLGCGPSPLHVHGLVPLAERNRGPEWYYACSFAQWPAHTAEGRDYWNKRFDSQYSDMLDMTQPRRVIVESGRYRSYHMPVFYRSALWVQWYAVGNLDAISDLLQDVWALGKKTVQGWGRVAAWEVLPWPEDWSVWRDGRPMRAIPASSLKTFPADLVYTGYRPSYWLRENQALCVVPTGEATATPATSGD
jgi:CRISPR type IV-associated protein Csf3